MMPNIADAAFLHGYEAVVDAFSVGDRFAPRRRIVVATGDTLSERMAGPAIRAWQIARALADEHDVVLVTTERMHADASAVSRSARGRAGCDRARTMVRRHHLPGLSHAAESRAARQRQGHRRATSTTRSTSSSWSRHATSMRRPGATSSDQLPRHSTNSSSAETSSSALLRSSETSGSVSWPHWDESTR